MLHKTMIKVRFNDTFDVMKNLFLIFLLLFSHSVLAGETNSTLSASDWDRPRSATNLIDIAVLKTLMLDYVRYPGSQLTINYSNSEEGNLWAYELRSWLIALGLASNAIKMQTGEMSESEINLKLTSQ